MVTYYFEKTTFVDTRFWRQTRTDGQKHGHLRAGHVGLQFVETVTVSIAGAMTSTLS